MMSMGELGKNNTYMWRVGYWISDDVCSLDEASAPGQIEVEKLNMLLEEISCD